MKKRYLLYLIILIFIPLKNVNAEASLELVCFDEVTIGYNVECKINLVNPDIMVKGVQANFEFGNYFSFVKIVENTDWKIPVGNKDGVVAINVDGVNNNSLVTGVNFIVSNEAVEKNEYEIKLNNIKLSDGEKDFSLKDSSVKVRVLSILDIVDSILVNGEMLEIEEGITNYYYQLKAGDKNADIVVNLKEDKYQFEEGYGSRNIQDLKDGKNEVLFKVKKDNREIINFTVNLNRENSEDKDNDVLSNPNTGNGSFIIVCIILFVSFVTLINKKYRKGEIK